jgi:hypothetical protein
VIDVAKKLVMAVEKLVMEGVEVGDGRGKSEDECGKDRDDYSKVRDQWGKVTK